MPFYEYECSKCGFRDEVLQQISDAPLKKCPNCGKNALRKLMSAPVFRLKGSGWYETDFKSDQENKRNLAGADKEEAKSETKSDVKTDAKADAKGEGSKEGASTEGAKVEAAKPDAGKSPDKPASKPAPARGARRAAAKAAPKRTKRPARR